MDEEEKKRRRRQIIEGIKMIVTGMSKILLLGILIYLVIKYFAK